MSVYHRNLQLLASNFIKSVDRFNKSFRSLSCHIHRPNIHRLLELVFHIIPMFNHLSYFCELVFESAHQPLKILVSRNHTLNSHVYAVQLNLGKDWLIRVWALWRLHRDENETAEFQQHAVIGLIRIFGGDEADCIYWTSSVLSSCLNDVREHIHHLMVGTVHNRLDKWYGDNRLTFNSTP